MENWKEFPALFVWIVYTLFVVVIVGFFVIHLIRRNLTQETKRKEELSFLEEKHLKDLLNKHVQTQEYERERIGSDLHDAISNRLNMILLKLRVSDNKNDIEEDINDTINTVRRIAHDLNPPLIDKIPIDVLVMSQFDRLLPKYELKKWSKSLNKTVWSVDRKIQIIRIIQELVNNIVKHSKATTVTVTLRERNRQLFIVVEDNGIGFSSDNRGMGFKNIENRLFILEGAFKIKSEKNKGVKVIIALNNGV